MMSILIILTKDVFSILINSWEPGMHPCGLMWPIAERIVVGRFVAGKEEPQEFKGDVPFHFQPGTLYRLTGKLIGALGEFGDTAVRYNNTIGPIPYFY